MIWYKFFPPILFFWLSYHKIWNVRFIQSYCCGIFNICIKLKFGTCYDNSLDIVLRIILYIIYVEYMMMIYNSSLLIQHKKKCQQYWNNFNNYLVWNIKKLYAALHFCVYIQYFLNLEGKLWQSICHIRIIKDYLSTNYLSTMHELSVITVFWGWGLV